MIAVFRNENEVNPLERKTIQFSNRFIRFCGVRMLPGTDYSHSPGFIWFCRNVGDFFDQIPTDPYGYDVGTIRDFLLSGLWAWMQKEKLDHHFMDFDCVGCRNVYLYSFCKRNRVRWRIL